MHGQQNIKTTFIVENPRQLHVSATHSIHLHALCITKYKNEIM